MNPFNVAVVQAAPILFDKKRTLEKVADLTSEVAKHNAKLVLFPETFIPCYPRGLSFGTVVGSRTSEGRQLWRRYWENSMDIPSDESEYLGNLAKAYQIYLAIGVTERERGTLYCSLLIFAPNGALIAKHRKIKPTAAERVIWGEGDGKSLVTHPTELGKIGGLICWENYMPLARMALYQQGIQIYLAPTADQREGWQATLKHIALEGRCFVLASNQFVTKAMYPKDLQLLDEMQQQAEIMSSGGSTIISPLGDYLTQPLYGKEGILYAEIDLNQTIEANLDFDVSGHYARPDIFHFEVLKKS